jgi:hypothetical protein
METVTLTFTPQQLAILNAALGELQYKTVAGLIADINIQLQAQRPQPVAA